MCEFANFNLIFCLVKKMKNILHIILITLISITIASCSSDDSKTTTTASGLFVATGNSATILTSTDGTTWTSRTSGISETNAIWETSYGNSTFVLVGDNGTILTSADGTSWTSMTSGTTDDLWGITYGNSTFVAVGDNGSSSGTILTSSDGTTWTSRTYGVNYWLYGVTYGNNTFVVGWCIRNHPHLNGWNNLDYKDFWNNEWYLWSHLREQYIRGGGFWRRNPNLFRWVFLDF